MEQEKNKVKQLAIVSGKGGKTTIAAAMKFKGFCSRCDRT